jgi:hypothetical protein
MSKMIGRAGSLMALVGILMFFLGVFSIAPRMFVFVGVGVIALSLAAFFIEEFSPRR